MKPGKEEEIPSHKPNQKSLESRCLVIKRIMKVFMRNSVLYGGYEEDVCSVLNFYGTISKVSGITKS